MLYENKWYPVSSTNSESEGGVGIHTTGLRGERLTRFVRRNQPRGPQIRALQETYCWAPRVHLAFGGAKRIPLMKIQCLDAMLRSTASPSLPPLQSVRLLDQMRERVRYLHSLLSG